MQILICLQMNEWLKKKCNRRKSWIFTPRAPFKRTVDWAFPRFGRLRISIHEFFCHKYRKILINQLKSQDIAFWIAQKYHRKFTFYRIEGFPSYGSIRFSSNTFGLHSIFFLSSSNVCTTGPESRFLQVMKQPRQQTTTSKWVHVIKPPIHMLMIHLSASCNTWVVSFQFKICWRMSQFGEKGKLFVWFSILKWVKYNKYSSFVALILHLLITFHSIYQTNFEISEFTGDFCSISL